MKKVINPTLKAVAVRKYLRKGYTLSQAATKFGFKSVQSLYNRFGKAIVGVSPPGRRAK